MKYTKEFLASIVAECKSVAQVMKKVGLKPNGGNQTYMRHRLKKLNIDISHFLGQGHNKGKEALNKQTWQEILVKRDGNRKEGAARLRRALVESGRPYHCEQDGCPVDGTWLDRRITLQVHHINGDILDNRKENLQFLCPNCHCQTDNWGCKG